MLSLGPPPPLLEDGVCHDGKGRQCRVCWGSRADYTTEQEAKRRAISWLWRDLGNPGPLSDLVSSPVGRRYRAVSKRKAIDGKLVLLDPMGHRLRPLQVRRCDIEPDSHAKVYATLQALLDQSPVRRSLLFVIVKSSSDSLIVILNLSDVHGVGRPLNQLSKRLTAAMPEITGLLTVEGKEDDSHYLDQNIVSFRKIYGRGDLRSRFGGKTFHYSPLSFSQVNHWMVDPLIKLVDGYLDPQGPLLDLYCGFGLFSLGIGGQRPTLGIEWSRAAIASAQSNARHQGAVHCRFMARDIKGELLPGWLRQANLQPTQAILDPPRGGPAPDLIPTLAALGLKRVVHLVCNVDRLGTDIKQWEQAGYGIKQAVPLDMFCGTPSLEFVLSVAPKERKTRSPKSVQFQERRRTNDAGQRKNKTVP